MKQTNMKEHRGNYHHERADPAITYSLKGPVENAKSLQGKQFEGMQ